jgi:hypothetical protein
MDRWCFPLVIKEGNLEITGMSTVSLANGLEGSNTLDKTLGPYILVGFLNKEKGDLKSSLTWTSMGSLGLVKGGL